MLTSGQVNNRCGGVKEHHPNSGYMLASHAGECKVPASVIIFNSNGYKLYRWSRKLTGTTQTTVIRKQAQTKLYQHTRGMWIDKNMWYPAYVSSTSASFSRVGLWCQILWQEIKFWFKNRILHRWAQLAHEEQGSRSLQHSNYGTLSYPYEFLSHRVSNAMTPHYLIVSVQCIVLKQGRKQKKEHCRFFLFFLSAILFSGEIQ